MTWVRDVSLGTVLFSKSFSAEVGTSIIKSFLSDMKLDSFDLDLTNQELEEFMLSEMKSKNLGCKQLEGTLHLAASLIEVRDVCCKPSVWLIHKTDCLP